MHLYCTKIKTNMQMRIRELKQLLKVPHFYFLVLLCPSCIHVLITHLICLVYMGFFLRLEASSLQFCFQVMGIILHFFSKSFL